MPVLAWQELAVNVLVEGVRDRTGWSETCPIYVRIVEVAGSSPVTSTLVTPHLGNRRSGDAYLRLAGSVPVRRARCVREAPKNFVPNSSTAALPAALVAWA
jgi:hypothetical protein